MTLLSYLLILCAGVLPALLWLWFWLREDRLRPEPRGLIALSFLAGMLAVPVVLPFERFVGVYTTGGTLLILWAAIEEVLKFGGAYLVVLRRKEMDEPIDGLIYMITVALGFAALENTLFLINSISDGEIFKAILTGNFRFFGATLLHTLSSALVGGAIALSFYRRASVKQAFLAAGVILAIALHTLFNFFIMKSNGEDMLIVFSVVWAGIIFLIFFFEKAKRIKNPYLLLRKK
jgi:RsiW-degrading membrane proteinase PrsW (M82 family)